MDYLEADKTLRFVGTFIFLFIVLFAAYYNLHWLFQHYLLKNTGSTIEDLAEDL